MKRTPLPRGGPLKRRTRLAPIGRRGRERRQRMAAVRPDLEQRAAGVCEAAGFSLACTGKPEHAHHVRMRSQGGDDTASNLLLVCHACHGWIHDNPTQARQRGLLR